MCVCVLCFCMEWGLPIIWDDQKKKIKKKIRSLISLPCYLNHLKKNKKKKKKTNNYVDIYFSFCFFFTTFSFWRVVVVRDRGELTILMVKIYRRFVLISNLWIISTSSSAARKKKENFGKWKKKRRKNMSGTQIKFLFFLFK